MSDIDDRAVDAPAEEAGVNPGERLAEARELLKLSTTDIARQLKLSVAQVDALEAGQFERLPGAVFVRGFIRNYARLVKLDPDRLLRMAGDRLPQQVSRPETPPSQDIPFPSARSNWWRKYAWAAAVLIAALAFYEFLVSEEETVVTTHPIEVAPAPAPAPVPVPVIPDNPKEEKASTVVAPLPGVDKTPAAGQAAAAGEARNKVKVPEPPPVMAAPMPAARPVAGVPAAGTAEQAAAAAVIVAPKPEADRPASNPGERQVTLVFEDESWVEIRDRHGKLILWQLNPAGTRQVVNGLPPLSFVIGNAHGVQLTYGDRRVDLAPYTKTDVARMTLE